MKITRRQIRQLISETINEQAAGSETVEVGAGVDTLQTMLNRMKDDLNASLQASLEEKMGLLMQQLKKTSIGQDIE